MVGHMLRFLGVASFVILFLILSIPLLLVEWLIGKFNRHIRDTSSLRIVQWAFRVCLRIAGVHATVYGQEHIPAEGSALFAMNHRSQFDILLTYVQMRSPAGFIAKKELEKFPLLNIWMRYLYCLFLDRSNPKKGVKCISRAIDYMKQGVSILICPEGKRGRADGMLPFKEGSFKIAVKANRPVVPVALYNTSAIFEDQFPRMKKTNVIVSFGEPIDPSSLPKEQQRNLGAMTQDAIQKMLDKYKSLM